MKARRAFIHAAGQVALSVLSITWRRSEGKTALNVVFDKKSPLVKGFTVKTLLCLRYGQTARYRQYQKT